MTLNLSNLSPAKGSIKTRKRVGRGGKKGTYSGRGNKGQRARSGGKSGLKALGLKQTLQRIPKNRGFKSLAAKIAVVNIDKIAEKFSDGEMINIKKLKTLKLVDSKETSVKILGNGKLDKKFTVVASSFSASAQKSIEDAGGKVELS